ncbi:MAG: YidC/Oxa1 family membrane protein insertase [Actinomycetota bacterium]|nr:YidC/Oxa1 family membrane protein insertase [Actinomycetota bacterium]
MSAAVDAPAVVPMLAASVLDPIYNTMGTVLAFFYSVIPSYGMAIALLTVTVRIFLIPLTTKQVKSQQAMQRIQPELKRLQAKYKNDRQKLNEEMMKFYRENKVNPLAGCLPILLQAPLFIVLYRLIIDLNARPEPKHLPRDSNLFTSLLESGGEMVSWGMDLARSAGSVGGIGNAFPYYVLVALTVATGYYQQRQMTARMPKGTANQQMQMIAKIFPVMIGAISLSVPAGVVVYFVVSNVWQIGQQAITFRIYPPPTVTTGGAKGDRDKGDKDKGDKDKTGKDGAGKDRAKAGRDSGTGGAKAGRDVGKGKGGDGARSSGGNGRPPRPGAGGAKKQAPKAQGKGKRPPPSPRPKGLPPPNRKPGQKGTSAKNSRRKDT